MIYINRTKIGEQKRVYQQKQKNRNIADKTDKPNRVQKNPEDQKQYIQTKPRFESTRKYTNRAKKLTMPKANQVK